MDGCGGSVFAGGVGGVPVTSEISSRRGVVAGFRGTKRTINPVHFSSETPEWYTPPEIIERVSRVFADCILVEVRDARPSHQRRYMTDQTVNGLHQPLAVLDLLSFGGKSDCSAGSCG